MDHSDIYLKLSGVVATVIALLYVQWTPSRPSRNVQPILGIDLGSAYMSVAVWTDHGVSVIYNTYGRQRTPAIVSFNEDGRIYIGDDASARSLRNTNRTFYSIYTLLGRSWDNSIVQEFVQSQFTTFTVVNSNGKPALQLNETAIYYPEEIVALFLSYLVSSAVDQLGQDVNKVVLTVPVYFNDHQRRAVKNAGKLAGLEVMKVLNAPTAVALYQSLSPGPVKSSRSGDKEDLPIMVIDFGTSHLDVSLVILAEGVIEAVASRGTEAVSGNKINKNIAKHFLKQNKRKYGEDPPNDGKTFIRFNKEIERIKRKLTYEIEATLEVENFYKGMFEFSTTLARDDFDTINKKVWAELIVTIQKLLRDSDYKISEISQVVLTGGSSRIPKIEQILRKTFTAAKLIKVDPDMLVTYGAALQGGILSHVTSMSDRLVLDINTASLGYETSHGNISTEIPKFQPLPVYKTVNFTTAEDYQTKMTCTVYEVRQDLSTPCPIVTGGCGFRNAESVVYNAGLWCKTEAGHHQGEDKNEPDSKWGYLIIDGIPPKYRKEFAMFEVTFKIDERGLYDFHMVNKSVEYETFEIKPAVRGLKSLEIPGLKANVTRLISEVLQRERRDKYTSKLEMCFYAIKWELVHGNLDEYKKKTLVKVKDKLKVWLDDIDAKTLLDLVSNALDLDKEISKLGLSICS